MSKRKKHHRDIRERERVRFNVRNRILVFFVSSYIFFSHLFLFFRPRKLQEKKSFFPRQKTKQMPAVVSAFFEGKSTYGNYCHLRRYSNITARVTRVGATRCPGCAHVLAVLERFACVEKVGFVPGDTCHRQVDLLHGHEDIHTITLPVNPKQVVAVLNRNLRIKRPFRPLRHQRDFIRRYRDELPKGLLLAFALGSGKTHAALGLLDATGQHRINIIAAVSLLPQWIASVKQHPLGVAGPVTDFVFRGYQRYAPNSSVVPRS